MKTPACFKGKTFLAVDQGSKLFGIVVVKNGRIVHAKAHQTQGRTVYERIDSFIQTLRYYTLLHDVPLLVYEGGTVFNHRDAQSRIVLCVLQHLIQRLGWEENRQVLPVYSSTVKRTVCNAARIQAEKAAGKRATAHAKKSDLRTDTIHLFGLSGAETQDLVDALAIAYTHCQ